MRAIPTLFDGDRIRSLDGLTDYIITSARSYGDAYAVEIITDEDGNEQQGEEILLSTNELRGYKVIERNTAGIIEYIEQHDEDWEAPRVVDAFEILAEECDIDLEDYEDENFSPYNAKALNAIRCRIPWYAVEYGENGDWDTGSYNYEEAVKIAKEMGSKTISVIYGLFNPTCEDEITDF